MARIDYRAQAIAELQANGPMSITDLADALGWERKRASTVILGARFTYPKKWFRIVDYRWQESQTGGREIPLYTNRGGIDKPRPEVGHDRRKAQIKAYYERHSARINATARAKRLKGMAVNPWLQLAQVGQRSVMTAAMGT